MKIGSLFSGYGGLERGVQSVLGGTVAWHSEIDPGACKILVHRYPDVPNLGDITTVDWAAVEPVDVLTAGYPCQPFSAAGKRQGTEDVRHLWPYVATVLGNLRPEWCLLENVRGHLTLGFDQVLRDLDLLHYEARWIVLRASDVGAPHGRARLFILGRNVGSQLRRRTDRRGGVHRNPGDGWVDAAPTQGGDDGQGLAELAGHASGVRGSSGAGPAGGRTDSGSARLEAEWQEGGRLDRAAATDVADEGRAGADRAAVPADDRRGTEANQPSGDLGRRDEASGQCLSCPHPGGEPDGSRSCAAGPSAGAPCGCAEVRGVVGAGRGSVRAGGVLWSAADLWTHDRWTDLPPGCEGQFDAVAVHAANTDHQGRQGAQPATGCDLPDGRATSDASSLRGERRRGHGDLAGPSGASQVDGGEREWDGNAADDRRATAADTYFTGLEGRESAAGHQLPAWGTYGDAIRRWERCLNRQAPAPTELNAKGSPRLSPRFVEWMMGLSAGWVTDVPGLTRNEQLKALGNGVVPQQAAEALRLLLPDVEAVAA